MKKIIFLLFLFNFYSVLAYELATKEDLNLKGALAIGYLKYNNTTEGDKDFFSITTGLINLENKITKDTKFHIELGVANQPLLTKGDITTNNNVNIHLTYVSVKTYKNVWLTLGRFYSNLGAEYPHTPHNYNITYGIIWASQPIALTGAKINYKISKNLVAYASYYQEMRPPFLNIYQIDNKTITANDGIELGINFNKVWKLNYLQINQLKKVLDLVYKKSINKFQFIFDLNLQRASNSLRDNLKQLGVSNPKKNAYGLGLYLKYNYNPQIALPIRFEYVVDGENKNISGKLIDNGLYNVYGNNAYSLTITPTYRFRKNQVIRFEIAYIKMASKNPEFLNNNGEEKKDRLVIALESIFKF